MATGSDNLEVYIDDERYSLLSVPEASSALVRAQRDNFSSKLDIEQFVEYMGHVGHFIKIAYNGVNAAGPRFTDLQIDIQRLGYDITKLCNESSITIDRFRVTASTVSSRLQSVYQFLLDGFDDAAIMSVTSLGELAQEMTKIACTLKENFDEQGRKVEATLETTIKRKSDESKRKEQLEKEQKEMEQKVQEKKELADRYDKLAREAKEERIKYEAKEGRALEERSGGPGLFNAVAGAMLTLAFPFAAGAIDDALHREERESAEKKKRLREISKEKREIELRQQNLHHEALQQMYEFASKLKNAKSEAEMAEVVIKALHETAGALRHLSVIMMEASKFWAHIRDHCNSLSDKNFTDLMGLYASKDEETKKKFWRSDGFIKRAVSYHSQWVALQSICEEHRKLIDATRADLYKYIQDNPTYEQSLKHLPQLTQNFLQILDKAKNEIEQKKRQQLTEN